jgi:hypothetical protein
MRMTAANNPAYAPRILATQTAWQNLFGNLETYDADRNQQQSFTIQLNAKQKEFIDKALNTEPLVVVKFGKASGTYQEFYPHGRTEYHSATQENIFHLMNRMIDGAHAHATELGPTLEAEFTTLRSEYQVIWDLQKEKKGDVSEAIPDFELKVVDLYDELYKNMLVILAENYKNPTAMLAFFDQTLVNYNTHIQPVLVQKNSTEAHELNFTVDNVIVISSKSDENLKYYFAPTAETVITDPPKVLAANAKVKIKGNEAGAPVNKFIIFINETGTNAKVEIRLA